MTGQVSKRARLIAFVKITQDYRFSAHLLGLATPANGLKRMDKMRIVQGCIRV